VAAVSPAAPARAPAITPRAELGRALFFDPGLSGSGSMSCASCHDPAHAYAPANALAVQLGGPELKTPGLRAVPSLMYKNYTLPYSDQYQNPDMVSPPAPGGGLSWDGRADTLAAQAAIPLLSPFEMANADRAAVVARLKSAPYAGQFRQVFGATVFDDGQHAFEMAGAALQAFQTEDRSFHPYSSKFDRFRRNKIGGTLSEQELRGLAVYVDPGRGNCMACHLIGGGNDGSQDITSDYSFAAIGVPRNPEIPANADPAYFDLGLCGPLREDHRPAKPGAANAWCGMFKAPILRNVATRGVFMHNGYFKSLKDVLRFYATRDTQPELWYPKDAAGHPRKFDDLPGPYRANLDPQIPLDQRKPGSKPALSDADIDDLLAFLQILNDGYQPPAAATPGPQPGTPAAPAP
ncbi:MAG: cytochrome-c peroxidase, partial [Solimonas sp.]